MSGIYCCCCYVCKTVIFLKIKLEKRREHVHKMAQLSTVRLFLQPVKIMCLVFGYNYKKTLE